MSDLKDLTFRQSTSSDTGENTTASIDPVVDGEKANQAVFRRPSENLRHRTEHIRRELLGQRYIRDEAVAGMMLSIINSVNGTSVTWHGDYTGAALPEGTFELEDDAKLIIEPFLNVQSTKLGSATLDEILITVYSRNWEGANSISFEYVHSPGVDPLNPIVTRTAGPEYHFTITFDNTNPPTRTAVANKINLLNTDSSTPNPFFHPDTVAAGTAVNGGAAFLNATVVTPGAAVYIDPSTTNPWYVETAGRQDPISHYISKAALAAFFSAETYNRLAIGDTLAIHYGHLLDPTGGGGGRQQSLKNGVLDDAGSLLFNTSSEPEKIPGAIPICRVDEEGALVFADGSRFTSGQTAQLGSTYYTPTESWYSGSVPNAIPAGDISDALNSAVEQLAADTSDTDCGTARVGGGELVDNTTFSPLILTLNQGSLKEQLLQLLLDSVAQGVASDAGAAWNTASGALLSATDVQAAIDEIVTSLAAQVDSPDDGASKIGVGPIETDELNEWPTVAGSVYAVLTKILQHLTTHSRTDTDAHTSDPTWTGTVTAEDFALDPAVYVSRYWHVGFVLQELSAAIGGIWTGTSAWSTVAVTNEKYMKAVSSSAVVYLPLQVPVGVEVTSVHLIVQTAAHPGDTEWILELRHADYDEAIGSSVSTDGPSAALSNTDAGGVQRKKLTYAVTPTASVNGQMWLKASLNSAPGANAGVLGWGFTGTTSTAVVI